MATKKPAESGIRADTFQTNFTAGEFSPLLEGRHELAKYKDAVSKLENFYTFPHGPVDKRPGTRFIAAVKTEANKTRLVPFIFSTIQAYILEFGNNYVRFYKDEGQILSGTAYEIVTTYTTAQLPDLKFTQSADVLYICHSAHNPRQLTRTGHTSWTLSDYDSGDGPYIEENTTSITLSPSGTTGSITITASSALFSAADIGRNIRIKQGSAWGAAKVTAFTDTTHVVATVIDDDDSAYVDTSAVTTWRLGSWYVDNWPAGQPTFFNNRLVFCNTTAEPNAFWCSRSSDFNSHKPTIRDGTVIDSNAINRIITDNQVNAIYWLVVDNADMFAGTSDGPFKIWSGSTTEAFSPTKVKVDKQTRDGATNLSPSPAGDAILYVSRSTLKVRELSFSFEKDKHLSANLSLLAEHILKPGIAHVEYTSEPDSIVWCILTDGSFISMTYKRDENVIAWHRQILGGHFGTATVTVTDYTNIATGATLKLNKSDGTTVTFTCQGPGSSPTPETNKFFHNESNDTTADNIYTAINLHADFTVANPAANVVTIEETSHGVGYLTITSSDTTRLAVTDEAAPLVESLAAVPGIGGTFDTLYMIVKRTINLATHRYVEFLEERFEPSSLTDKDDAFFLDSGLSYSGVAATTITGLSHLEGETVKILANGATHANKTVSSGQIVLDRSTTRCHVGLGYTSKLVTLPLDAAMTTGTAQGKTKRISEVLLRLYKSLGGQIGPSEDNLERMLTRSGLSPMDSSPPLETGDRILNFNGPHERQAKVTVIHDEPLPFTLVAIGPRAEIQKR